ncbi:MAG TPA: hypothetical protein VF167_02770 [Longimicrobiaceae bacterium]
MSAPRDGSGGSGESEPNRAGSHAGESTKKAGKDELPPGRLQLAAIGLEAEFSLVVDGRPARPERVFGDPRSFLGGGRMHRVGTSYHLNTGGAVYFDTGVIEVATPVIEIARGCAARAGRSLWEGVLEVRSALDRWERSTRHDARLVGFSTHYNISFELPRALRANGRSVEDLALVLTYLLPPPVMLLAANPRSTGIGVRPRGDRIEVTADFTPSPSLMIATATLITGIVRSVMRWPSFELVQLEQRGLPVMRDFKPIPHTSRQGWLARKDCYPRNPFRADIDEPSWAVTSGETLSLRQIARRTVRYFWRVIQQLSDPFTFRLIGSVIGSRAPSLLELPDRPVGYEDVGRLCTWDNLFPEHKLSRSLYERVLIRAISGQKLRMHSHYYTPVRMQGWTQVVFRRDDNGSLHTFPIDYLIRHLESWERVS